VFVALDNDAAHQGGVLLFMLRQAFPDLFQVISS